MRGGGGEERLGDTTVMNQLDEAVPYPHSHLGGHDVMVCGKKHSLVDVASGKEVSLPDERKGEKCRDQEIAV